MGGCEQVICTYYTILYKELECLQILVSVRSPGTNSQWISRQEYVCVYLYTQRMCLYRYILMYISYVYTSRYIVYQGICIYIYICHMRIYIHTNTYISEGKTVFWSHIVQQTETYTCNTRMHDLRGKNFFSSLLNYM